MKQLSSNKIIKVIRSLGKRVTEHEGYINDPPSHDQGWFQKDPRTQAGLIKHWQKEIDNFNELIDAAKQILHDRGEPG